MIDWSLNPKKSVLTQKATSTATEGPLAPSKHANKAPPSSPPLGNGGEENGGAKAQSTVKTVTADADPLCDEDDLDALEALAAAEALATADTTTKVDSINKEEVTVEVQKD
jgi:uracil-DNA glycosylase